MHWLKCGRCCSCQPLVLLDTGSAPSIETGVPVPNDGATIYDRSASARDDEFLRVFSLASTVCDKANSRRIFDHLRLKDTRIGVPKESAAGERRIAIAPDVTARLVKAGHEVLVERGAGAAAFMPDPTYEAAGAKLVDAASAYGADIVTKVQAPSPNEAAMIKDGALL